MAKIKEAKLQDLIQDDRNLNKGTELGQELIEKSLREFGAGRSILIDKNNRIIAGNKTHDNAKLAGLDDVLSSRRMVVSSLPLSVLTSI